MSFIPSVKVKFLKGWITTEKMDNDGWFYLWKQTAIEAENENCELVIFKIPKQRNGLSNYDLTSRIEVFLQETLKD